MTAVPGGCCRSEPAREFTMTRPAESIITRSPAEMYGRHSGYGFAGLSVNTAIGNFTQTSVDLPFGSGMLGLLNWGRTYNSVSATPRGTRHRLDNLVQRQPAAIGTAGPAASHRCTRELSRRRRAGAGLHPGGRRRFHLPAGPGRHLGLPGRRWFHARLQLRPGLDVRLGRPAGHSFGRPFTCEPVSMRCGRSHAPCVRVCKPGD